DQLLKLKEFCAAVEPVAKICSSVPSLVSRYDGATPTEARSQIRGQVQVLLTNPDMLHLALLPWHERHWWRFFTNLKHVVIDWGHEYRGIFGSNVAYIIRRLQQLCKRYGSSPTFVATSATIADPRDHLEQLTGLPFVSVDDSADGSMQGRKKFWLM